MAKTEKPLVVVRRMELCRNCQGAGNIDNCKCHVCRGHGRVLVEKEIKITIITLD